MKPKFSKKLPLSYQVTKLLRDRILSGQYGEGFQLPSEAQLTGDFGVSIITVRAALGSLSDEGLIRRLQGKGTFVAKLPKHLDKLNALVPLNFLYSKDISADSEITDRAVISTPPNVRKYFPRHKSVATYRRLERLAGHPRSYAIHYFWPELNSRINNEMLTHQTMLAILPALGVPLKRIEVEMQARTASVEIGRVLEIDSTSAVMQATVAGFNEADEIVNVLQIHLAGDRFVYRVHMEP